MADIAISSLPAITTATNDDFFVINDANATSSIINWDNLKQSIEKLSGQIVYDAGSESAPTIAFSADINTGLYSPGSDQLALVTNGSDRLYIDAAGRVGLNNSSPGNYWSSADDLVIGAGSGDTGISLVSSTTGAGFLSFADGDSASDENVGYIGYNHSTNHFEFHAGGSEVFRIEENGYLGIGTNDPQSIVHVTSGDSGATGSIAGTEGVILEAAAGTDVAVQMQSGSNDANYIYFGDADDLDIGYVKYDHADNSFGIRVNNRDILHIASTGQLGLSTPATNQMLSLNGLATGAPVLVGYEASSELQADVTGSFTYYRTNSSNAAGGGLTNLYHYSVNQGTYGSTVTNQYGYFIGNSMSGATNNYGFYSNVPGSSNYQFYAAGSAKNYFNGQDFVVAIGGQNKLEVANDGNTTITGDLNFTGDIYKDGVLFQPGGNASSSLGTTPPADPGQGDIWFDTDAGNSYIYYNDGDSTQWIEMSPSKVSGLLADTVNTLSLQDLSVTTAKLGNSSVTESKILPGAVSPAKLSTGGPNWDTAGDLEPEGGLILTSPNGTRYRLIVDNSGALSTEAV